jgi:Domain of unknown function (DUF6306)
MKSTISPSVFGESPSVAGSAELSPADAARDAVLAALNELLEAERAGARVAMETAREITGPDLAALVQDIHKDEVHWCSVLMRTIKSMGATPSAATGAFWGKAMAIPDVTDRLKFLNRGQSWVVRKLEELIPRIETEAARAELNNMLHAHHQNIGLVEAKFSSPTAPAASLGNNREPI